ncbi:PREDICTED: probable cytochrome P450 12a5, mitochondrial [Ceratosolen solmsi marchali]|uniref:Probable cytochrome P450 12a5, mitochondrial n=1 Tax=Ceratosolen solmsi marchali TaxID=326594 RepID=A0AAJ6YBP3_9HYME|nr:PREDICTED: probable cytochrome P450 12a5, mitochondrial [Ceratosolen solmsi marchali]
MAVEEQTNTIPLLDQLDTKATKRIGDITVANVTEDLMVHKPPISFEEIPGPALLKLLDKYWKYVPLLGTQLFRSVLINRLTEGRLTWNRNIRPLKYLFNEYGPVVRLNGPFAGDIVLIHRPEHIAKVFEEEGDSPTRSGIDVLQHYRLNYRKYRFSGPYNSQGLQSMQWLQTKKVLETPIAKQINKEFEKFEMACDELLIRIRQIKNRQDEVSGDFSNELSRWSMECFWIFMISKKIGFLDSTSYNKNSEITRFIETLATAHHYMSRCETGFQFWRMIDTPYSKKLFSACDIIDGIIGKYIRNAQSHVRNNLSMHEDENQHRLTILENLLFKQRMNPEELATLLMDMIILGVNATTNSQAFLLYYLAKNPRIQRRLHEEVISKTPKDHSFTSKTFIDMPYLNACINECLRLRPAFPYITRLLSKQIILHGYKIPKGTYIIMANQISSQREENFEDPDKFKPDRWLKSSDDSYPQNSYLPFGKGIRNCIGENLAKLEMMLLTIKIIREFIIEYDYADIESRFLMMNVPDRPLRFRFISRN